MSLTWLEIAYTRANTSTMRRRTRLSGRVGIETHGIGEHGGLNVVAPGSRVGWGLKPLSDHGNERGIGVAPGSRVGWGLKPPVGDDVVHVAGVAPGSRVGWGL